MSVDRIRNACKPSHRSRLRRLAALRLHRGDAVADSHPGAIERGCADFRKWLISALPPKAAQIARPPHKGEGADLALIPSQRDTRSNAAARGEASPPPGNIRSPRM